MTGKLRRLGAAVCVFVLSALALVATGPAPTASGTAYACTSATPTTSRPTLRKGDTGTCVRTLQALLAADGYDVNTDGVFTDRTYLAVRRYQSAFLNLSIDGVVGQPTWTTLVTGKGTPYSREKGPNLTAKVVLSYDDCPASLSAFKRTVDYARGIGLRLVLFTYGDCLDWGLIDVAYARAAGHYVFNHSRTHADLSTLSYSGVLSELGAPGPQTNYGRPPYGNFNFTTRNAYAAKAMRIWTWNVDTEDWTGKSQASVVSFVNSKAYAGSTVLMHMQFNAFNPTALAQMKSGLAARGLSICRNNGPVVASPARLDC